MAAAMISQNGNRFKLVPFETAPDWVSPDHGAAFHYVFPYGLEKNERETSNGILRVCGDSRNSSDLDWLWPGNKKGGTGVVLYVYKRGC